MSAFRILEDAVAAQSFPCAVAAVSHRGKLAALKAVGRLTFDPGAPFASVDTVFDLASITKAIATTTMAALLYQRGLLDLDMPVAAVVPEFVVDESGSPDPRRSEITFRMLLAHSSGLPAHRKLYEQAQTCDQLIALAATTPLVNDPEWHTEYSDIGFILLGEALTRLADEGIDTFCQREVFGPLGIWRTGFNPPVEQHSSIPPTFDDQTFRHQVVQGKVNDENASVMGGVAGHAGLFAPAEDVAIFAEAMINGGAPILRPETLALFTRRQPLPPGTSRTLGWDTPSSPSQSGTLFSPTSFGHLGYSGTSLWIDPERRISITLLTNRTWPDGKNKAIQQVRPAFHNEIMKILLER